MGAGAMAVSDISDGGAKRLAEQVIGKLNYLESFPHMKTNDRRAYEKARHCLGVNWLRENLSLARSAPY